MRGSGTDEDPWDARRPAPIVEYNVVEMLRTADGLDEPLIDWLFTLDEDDLMDVVAMLAAICRIALEKISDHRATTVDATIDGLVDAWRVE